MAGFSTDYLIDLVTRFINWQMIGAILFYSWPVIPVTMDSHYRFVVAILLWLNVLTGGTKFLLVASRSTDDHCNNDGW